MLFVPSTISSRMYNSISILFNSMMKTFANYQVRSVCWIENIVLTTSAWIIFSHWHLRTSQTSSTVYDLQFTLFLPSIETDKSPIGVLWLFFSFIIRHLLCAIIVFVQAFGASKFRRKSSCKQPLMNSSLVNARSPFKSNLIMIFSTRFAGEFSPLRFSSPRRS